jgi:glycerol-3-phosphate dehydrogenase (NAD(P)+)
VLWCHHTEIAHEIMTTRINKRYMPGVLLHNTISAISGSHIAPDTFREAYICEAIPVQYLRSVVSLLKPYCNLHIPWIITSKGIEKETLLLPSEIVTDVLGYVPQYGVCMGPSFARDLIQEKKTGLVIATQDQLLTQELQILFKNDTITLDTSTDTLGLQICAAFKNVVAFLVGASDGAGHGNNARALLVTRCFQKMTELVLAAGGNLDTVHGLGGFGDLFLTASSTESRNYIVGKLVGEGKSLEDVLTQTGLTSEGTNTATSIVAYAHRYGVNLSALRIDEYIKT